MPRPSRTSDDHSAPDPIGKPGRCERDHAEFARDSGCGRLRKPRPSIRFAAYRRVDAPDALGAPGGVDAPDGGVSCGPPRVPARRRHSASRVRSRITALPFSASRPGVRGPASPSGRLPRSARRRTIGRASATLGTKHSGTCAQSVDTPGGTWPGRWPGRLSLVRRSGCPNANRRPERIPRSR